MVERRGKPAIAVNRGGPAESIIDGVTGLLADPDAAAFADCMERLASAPDFTERLGIAGNKDCRRFSWDPFTARIDAELERMTGSEKGINAQVSSDTAMSRAGSQ